MPRQMHGLGWKPDLPDHRDFSYAAPVHVMAALPAKADLRPKCPSIYDQGEIGSCTANAIAAAVEFDQRKQQRSNEFTPSRLFIYYNERAMEHTVQLDNGAQIRDGIKSVAKLGVCPEKMWPYKDDHPDQEGQPCPTCTFATKPSPGCYQEAKKHTVASYSRIPRNLNSMKACLASGFPFVLGFTCYDNLPFQSKNGVIPMPGPKNQVIGGHAVLAVGYDDHKQMFTIRNSWGRKWGAKGYGFMPYNYLLQSDLSDDFWTIRFVNI
jgi:C1A family cysteine protease